MHRTLPFVLAVAALVSQAHAKSLYDAIKDGDIVAVRQFISDGESLDQNHKTFGTPLHHVSIWGNAEMAELLFMSPEQSVTYVSGRTKAECNPSGRDVSAT